MANNLDLADKIAMYLGGGLIILGIPVMGLLTTLAGSMSPLYSYTAGEQSGHVLAPAMAPEGAQIVTAPLFSPNLRATIILAGFAIWTVYVVYKLFAGVGSGAPEPSGTTTQSD